MTGFLGLVGIQRLVNVDEAIITPNKPDNTTPGREPPITLPTQATSQSGRASPATKFVNTPLASKPIDTPLTRKFFNTPSASKYEKTPPVIKYEKTPVHPTQTAGQAVDTLAASMAVPPPASTTVPPPASTAIPPPASMTVTPQASRAAVPPASRTVGPIEGSYENPISVEEDDLPSALLHLLDYGFSVTRI